MYLLFKYFGHIMCKHSVIIIGAICGRSMSLKAQIIYWVNAQFKQEQRSKFLRVKNIFKLKTKYCPRCSRILILYMILSKSLKKIRIVSRHWNDNLCFQCRRLEFEVENCTVKQIYDLTGCVTNIS